MSGRLCPLCSKADAIQRDGHVAVAKTEHISVAVTLPEKICGRCGQAIADAAILAVLERWGFMRGGK